ncbi:hypothetical protein EJB05_28786, partial [Eragrostis curvula]
MDSKWTSQPGRERIHQCSEMHRGNTPSPLRRPLSGCGCAGGEAPTNNEALPPDESERDHDGVVTSSRIHELTDAKKEMVLHAVLTRAAARVFKCVMR